MEGNKNDSVIQSDDAKKRKSIKNLFVLSQNHPLSETIKSPVSSNNKIIEQDKEESKEKGESNSKSLKSLKASREGKPVDTKISSPSLQLVQIK